MNKTLRSKKLSNSSNFYFTLRSVYKIVFLSQIYFIPLKNRDIDTTIFNKVN